MLKFHAAPAVPVNYPRLSALTAEEIEKGQAAGYIEDLSKPAVEIDGHDNCMERGPDIDMQDWRVRMYVIWFCFIYENFLVIQRPLYAIEELFLEFQGLDIIDPKIASLYAGCGSWELDSREHWLQDLRPYYNKCLSLLDEWRSNHSL